MSNVMGTPAVAFTAAGFAPDTSNNTLLPWPSYLPGWGMLTVSRNLLAEEYDMGLLNQPGALDSLPHIFTIRRQGNGTCDNPYDFPRTRAVYGTLCPPEGEEYESAVKEVTGTALAELEAGRRHCACRCKCQLGCIGKL